MLLQHGKYIYLYIYSKQPKGGHAHTTKTQIGALLRAYKEAGCGCAKSIRGRLQLNVVPQPKQHGWYMHRV
jgi:hypothetical protein